MASPATSGSSSRVGSCPRSVQQQGNSGRMSRSGSGSPVLLQQQQQRSSSDGDSLRHSLSEEGGECFPVASWERHSEASGSDVVANIAASTQQEDVICTGGEGRKNNISSGDVDAASKEEEGKEQGGDRDLFPSSSSSAPTGTGKEKSHRSSITPPPAFQFVSSRLRAQAERQAAAAAANPSTQHSTSSSNIHSTRDSPSSQSPYPPNSSSSSSSSYNTTSSSSSVRHGGYGGGQNPKKNSPSPSPSPSPSSCTSTTSGGIGSGPLLSRDKIHACGGISLSRHNDSHSRPALNSSKTRTTSTPPHVVKGSSHSRTNPVTGQTGSHHQIPRLSIGRRGGGMWCYICRDSVQRGEENVVECGACPKRFHVECLQQEGLLQTSSSQCGGVVSRGSGGGVVVQGEWLCPQCEEEQEEDEMQNDERCFICKKKEADSEDRLLLCDGCPNSYHMRSCLKMTIEPDEEKWFCPECNPAAFKRDEVRRLGRRGAPGLAGGAAGHLLRASPSRVDTSSPHQPQSSRKHSLSTTGDQGNNSTSLNEESSTKSPSTEGGNTLLSTESTIVNASSCYVCQRPGKLLGCDFCPNSFHPGCLVDVDWNNIGEEWECPVCRGQDPLANQMHKRWTRAEIELKRKERAKCLLRIRAKTVRYRNRFLLVHQKDLGPFVHPKVWTNLAKSLRAQATSSLPGQHHTGSSHKKTSGAGGGRLQVERSMADLLEGLEDEAIEECAKFVKRAYRATRYPSGRKIEGVPLREGIELKPHQEEGVEWLLCSFMTGGGILADEMGLGKTIQTLCFLSYLNAMKLEGPHLIVVPLSTVGNWMREVHRFTPSLTHIKICGSRAERQHALEDRLAQRGLYDLYITTYETVKSEEEFFVEVIPHWQCIVLDEAHRIKNASGGIRHSLDRVVGNMRLLLTGTPLQNSAAELFTLINFLMPDVFRDSQLIEQAFLSAQQQQQLIASRQQKQQHHVQKMTSTTTIAGGISSRGGGGNINNITGILTTGGGGGGSTGGGCKGVNHQISSSSLVALSGVKKLSSSSSFSSLNNSSSVITSSSSSSSSCTGTTLSSLFSSSGNKGENHSRENSTNTGDTTIFKTTTTGDELQYKENTTLSSSLPSSSSSSSSSSSPSSVSSSSQTAADKGGVEVEELFRQEDLEKIRNLLDRVMLRRLKEQAIALPKKIFHSVWLPLSGCAAAWYERLLRIRALQEASKERLHESSYRKMLGLVIKMRIICAHPKALCARDSQMQRLQTLFLEEEAAIQQEVTTAACELQQLEGEQHIRCSAKLCFLDKLLCHLHTLNCRHVPGYEREYDNHRREAATYKFYKQHEEKVKEAIAGGRKPPRRPKRVELPGLVAFQLLLQKGDPRLAGVKTASNSSFLEESMYAAELVMPVLPERTSEGGVAGNNNNSSSSRIHLAVSSSSSSLRKESQEEEKEKEERRRLEKPGRLSRLRKEESEEEDEKEEEDDRVKRRTITMGKKKIVQGKDDENDDHDILLFPGGKGEKKEQRNDLKAPVHLPDSGRKKYSSLHAAASKHDISYFSSTNQREAAIHTTTGDREEKGREERGRGGGGGGGGGGKRQLKLQVATGNGGLITLQRDTIRCTTEQFSNEINKIATEAATEAGTEAARAATLAIDEEEEEEEEEVLPRTTLFSKKRRGLIIIDEDEKDKLSSSFSSSSSFSGIVVSDGVSLQKKKNDDDDNDDGGILEALRRAEIPGVKKEEEEMMKKKKEEDEDEKKKKKKDLPYTTRDVCITDPLVIIPKAGNVEMKREKEEEREKEREGKQDEEIMKKEIPNEKKILFPLSEGYREAYDNNKRGVSSTLANTTHISPNNEEYPSSTYTTTTPTDTTTTTTSSSSSSSSSSDNILRNSDTTPTNITTITITTNTTSTRNRHSISSLSPNSKSSILPPSADTSTTTTPTTTTTTTTTTTSSSSSSFSLTDTSSSCSVPNNKPVNMNPSSCLSSTSSSSSLMKNDSVSVTGQQQQKGKTPFEIDRSQPRLQRLLVFTQFQLVLDELESYCQFRGWKYLRLDGSTNKFVRELDIRDFNSDNSTYFVYLISTRAGGLGINLTAANHVVLYDHDWNPFIDLQAVDRAHRIGQQREVHVWSLVSEWTVEERMAFRRDQKLRLDKLLVQHQQEESLDVDDEEKQQNRGEKISTDEIRRLMLHGRKAIMEVAAKRPIEIFDCSLEELASRQRLRLPELCSSSSSGGTGEGRGRVRAGVDIVADGGNLIKKKILSKEGEEGMNYPGGGEIEERKEEIEEEIEIEEEDRESREETEEQELVDIDEVMNEEAEEQLKQQQLLESADGMIVEESQNASEHLPNSKRDITISGRNHSNPSSSSSFSSRGEEVTSATETKDNILKTKLISTTPVDKHSDNSNSRNDTTCFSPEGSHHPHPHHPHHEDDTTEKDRESATTIQSEDKDILSSSSAISTATPGTGEVVKDEKQHLPSTCCGAASPSSSAKGDLEKELQSAGVLWRSGRERKKPIAVYVPQEFGQREERKKIRHEQRCFICGQSRDYEQVIRDGEGREHKIILKDLVCCSGCPRAYHRECEGLGKEVKKSWRCRWHECCLCFRKTSQCGNMLIHCARCPTSFCYDCFPPDYCRYNVGEEYYSQLRQRGMNVTPQNWILLLCSRCKAVEEQQTRRRLTKEEKEQEKQQQKELRQQQKELHEVCLDVKRGRGGGGGGGKNSKNPHNHSTLHLSTQHPLNHNSKKDSSSLLHSQTPGGGGIGEGRQRLAEEDKRFFENKHLIDAVEGKLEEELRQAYQRLFPPAFTEELYKRVHAAKAVQKLNKEASLAMQAQAAAAALAEGRNAAAQENLLLHHHHNKTNASSHANDTGTTATATEHAQQQQQQKLHAAIAAAQQAAIAAKKSQHQQKRPVNQLVNMKLPGASLGLCDNCRLPCHGVKDYSASCCFPLEVISKFFLRLSNTGGSSFILPSNLATQKERSPFMMMKTEEEGDGEKTSSQNSAKEKKHKEEEEEKDRRHHTAEMKQENLTSLLLSSSRSPMGGVSGTGGTEGTGDKTEKKEDEDEDEEEKKKRNASANIHNSETENQVQLDSILHNALLTTPGIKALSPTLKHILNSPNIITGVSIDAAVAAEVAAAGIDWLKVVHKQVCGCCGECRTGKRSHLRKHCLSLPEEEKVKYAERRELVQQLIGWLQQQTPLSDTAAAGYSSASPQRIKTYYQQYQAQADRVVEAGMMAVGLGSAVTQRSFARRPYNTSGTPGSGGGRSGTSTGSGSDGGGGQTPVQASLLQLEGVCVSSNNNTKEKRRRSGGSSSTMSGTSSDPGAAPAVDSATVSSPLGGGGGNQWMLSGQQKGRKRTLTTPTANNASPNSSNSSRPEGVATGGSVVIGAGGTAAGAAATGGGGGSSGRKRTSNSNTGRGGHVFATAGGGGGATADKNENSGSQRSTTGSGTISPRPRVGREVAAHNSIGHSSSGDMEMSGMMSSSPNASVHHHLSQQQQTGLKNTKGGGGGGNTAGRRGETATTSSRATAAGGSTAKRAGGGGGHAGGRSSGAGVSPATGGRDLSVTPETGISQKLLVNNPWNPTTSSTTLVMLPAGGGTANPGMNNLLHAKEACASLGVKLLQAAAARAAGPLMKGNFSASAAAATAASLAAGMRAAAKRPVDNSTGKAPADSKRVRTTPQSSPTGAGGAVSIGSLEAVSRAATTARSLGETSSGTIITPAGPGGLEAGAATLLKKRKSPCSQIREQHNNNNNNYVSAGGVQPQSSVPIDATGLHNNNIAFGGGVTPPTAPQPSASPAPFKQQKSIIDFFLTKTKGGGPMTNSSLSYAADNMRPSTAAPVSSPLAALAALVAARRATSGGAATSPSPPNNSGAAMGSGCR